MRQSLQRRLVSLESEYLMLLKAALKQCASGHWGLFGHNDRAISQLGRPAQENLVSFEARQLLDLGGEIEALRRKLAYAEPFAPHARLTEMRASVDANTPGEPKRAEQWLKELEAAVNYVRS
jgi:hypothetical protein